jgi:hypothetical protein
MKRLYTVYRQDPPQDTGIPMRETEDGRRLTWHRAQLTRVGEAASFEEAKKLCARPVMEAKQSDLTSPFDPVSMGQRIVGARRWQ